MHRAAWFHVASVVSMLAPAVGCGGSEARADWGVDAAPDARAPLDSAAPDDDAPGSIDDSGAALIDATETPESPAWSPSLVALAGACTDSATAVYVVPTSLPTFSLDARGDVIRCSADPAIDLATVGTQLTAKGIDLKPTTGVHVVRIAFRTTRGSGKQGVSSARVYLPDTPRAGPLPVIVAAHPTEGLASACASSRDPAKLQEVALPWAARGYAVIAPDYAGFGTEGVQGYQDNRDTGHSVLDAARALRKLLKEGAFSDAVLLTGWSQGGGAVLSAQALENDYGCGGRLKAVIAFAPQWATRPVSFGLANLLAHPEALTITMGITNPVVAAMESYAWSYNYVSSGAGTTPFPAGKRAGMESALQGLCLKEFGGYLQGVDFHVRDIFDEPFSTSLAACLGGDTSAGCVAPGKPYAAFLRNNVLKSDPKGAPVLYVQGLADTIMPPAQEAACNLAKMATDGVKPQVCTDSSAQHTNVVQRNVPFSVSWGEAILAGSPAPTCSSAGMPACAE